MLRKVLTAAAILLTSISANAQKAILEAFKPVSDSISVLAKEHFRVRSHLQLNKAMKRERKRKTLMGAAMQLRTRQTRRPALP